MALWRVLDKTSAALRAAIKRPPKERNDRQNRNAERAKASPLNRLAIAFANSLGGGLAAYQRQNSGKEKT